MTAKEELAILHNILARGGGIDQVDLHVELAKAMSAINSMKAQGDVQNMANNPVLTSPQPPQSTISPQTGQSATSLQSPLGNPVEGNINPNTEPNYGG